MPEPLTDVDLAAIRERCDAAAPGPWELVAADWTITPHRADYVFIAAARTDVPRLLAEVERLQSEVTRWRGLLREAADEIDRQREILERIRQVGTILRTATEEEGPENRGSSGLERTINGIEQAVSILLNRRDP